MKTIHHAANAVATTIPTLPGNTLNPLDYFNAGLFILLALFSIWYWYTHEQNRYAFLGGFYLAVLPAFYFTSKVTTGVLSDALRLPVDLFVVLPLGLGAIYFLFKILSSVPYTEDTRSREYYPYTDKTRRYRL